MEKEIQPITPDQEKEIWQHMFNMAGDKAEELGVSFNIFDLYSLVNRGIMDITINEVAPSIGQEMINKIGESGIPLDTTKRIFDMLNHFVEEGELIKGEPLTALEMFYMTVAANYAMSELLDVLLYDSSKEDEQEEKMEE